MNNSGTSEENSIGADDAPERPPRYEQVIRWAEYIKEHPRKVWGPQQNAVVNDQIESAQAVDVSVEDNTRIREFERVETSEKIDNYSKDAEQSAINLRAIQLADDFYVHLGRNVPAVIDLT